MRTRSQGPAIHEERFLYEAAVDAHSIALAGNGPMPGLWSQESEGGSLRCETEKVSATIRTDLEVLGLGQDKSVEVRRPSGIPDKQVAIGPKPAEKPLPGSAPRENTSFNTMAPSSCRQQNLKRLRSPWSCSFLTILVSLLAGFLAVSIFRSFQTRQLDVTGYQMTWTSGAYARYTDFDTEHTRFACKYSLYLYREGGVDEDNRVKGIPVLFIPGNAGSYRQVRSHAAEAAIYFQQVLQNDPDALKNGKRPLDFFTVDFNEDITAFHGQTLLDQAEYLNEAIAYILALYHNPNRSMRDTDLPDPTSVILLGHSMGGVVARTMLTMPNHQSNSVNTIVTLAAPHARPPVSFDAEIVHTYKKVNKYWRKAYSQKWANDNPLWHVTTISIAGGGRDTMVPSDYSTLASLVPPTHGFTVFTSSIPRVWMSMDHEAIIWADQARKAVVHALYDIVDATRPSQTRARAERMHVFKKWFLPGLEDVAERTLPQREPRTLLTLDNNSNSIIAQGERFVINQFGETGRTKAYLLPVPLHRSPERTRFTLLTDQVLGPAGSEEQLEVMFCSVFPLHGGQSSAVFSMNMDLSGNSSGSTRLACKNAASDAVLLPSSTRNSKHPFDDTSPFSYLQYDLEQLSDHQFVAVVDKAGEVRPGWLIAEFASVSDSVVKSSKGLASLVLSGLNVAFSFKRPMVIEISISSMASSLLAYSFSISRQSSGDSTELFMPLLRQHVSDPYESKFFVNAKEADISMHGIAPYMPPPLRSRSDSQGLSLQIWSDPTCNSTMEVTLRVDLLGSMGKLWMRYRTVFAAFPLLVVALVLRKQFKTHDETGVFMSFSESMDHCLRRSIPMLFLALTLLATSFTHTAPGSMDGIMNWRSNATESIIDFTKNDLLLGTTDPFFWFLVPLFGLISIGVCIALNVFLLCITYALSSIYTFAHHVIKRPLNAFTVTTLRRRMIITSILLFLVWTVIPYQFLFIVLCVAQLSTCVRALSWARANHTPSTPTPTFTFYNYTHSLLLLMLWLLPINLPILIVWIHNLAVHWLTPFTSHHNLLSITPFVLLVETLSTGKMIPRLISWPKHVTSVLFFGLAMGAAVYGVSYAYSLHYLVNAVFAWIMGVYLGSMPWSWGGLGRLLEGRSAGGGGGEEVGVEKSGGGGRTKTQTGTGGSGSERGDVMKKQP